MYSSCHDPSPPTEILKDELTMQELVRDYLCPLCNEIIYHAVQTNCGHNFCRYCLLKWILKNTTCPLCEENYESYKLLDSIDSYIDNEFASVDRKLQEQRQGLIGSRYFPERQLCIQDMERLAQAKVQKQARRVMDVKQFTSRGDINRSCTSDITENTESIPDCLKVKKETSEISVLVNQNKPPTLLRHNSRISRTPKTSLEDYSKFKAEIRDILMKTERQKDLIKSNAELKLRQLFKAEPVDHFPTPEAETECENDTISAASLKPKTDSEDIAQLIRSADRMREYTEKRLLAEAEVHACEDDETPADESRFANNRADESRFANNRADESRFANNRADESRFANNRKDEQYESGDKNKDNIREIEIRCSPKELKEPLSEILKSHESRLRIQVERFKTETEELIQLLKSAGRELVAGKVESHPKLKQEIDEAIAAKQASLRKLGLRKSTAKLIDFDNEQEAETDNQRNAKSKPKKQLECKPVAIRKPSFRVRCPRPDRRKFKIRNRYELSVSTTSSLEALNSNSLTDLTSVTGDLKPPAQESRKEDSKSKVYLINDGDCDVPGQASLVKCDADWYGRGYNGNSVSTEKMTKSTRSHHKQVKKNPEEIPEWFANSQKMGFRNPVSKILESLESGNRTKSKSTRTDNATNSAPTLNSSIRSFPYPTGKPHAENIGSSYVFGTKLDSKRLPKLYEMSKENRNLDNDLLFGLTSPYLGRKPGMTLFSDKPPHLPFGRSETISNASFTRSAHSSTAEPPHKPVTQKDKDRLISQVRKQMEEEAQMRHLLLEREDLLRKLMKERKIIKMKTKKKTSKLGPK